MPAIALAANGAASPQSGIMSFIPIILIVGVFYFLLIRPQQKKAKEHQAMLAALQKGDEVVTTGGLHGTITGLTDTVATLEIADKVRVKVSRQHILGTAKSGAGQGEAGASCAPGAGGG